MAYQKFESMRKRERKRKLKREEGEKNKCEKMNLLNIKRYKTIELQSS